MNMKMNIEKLEICKNEHFFKKIQDDSFSSLTIIYCFNIHAFIVIIS